jgi:hypothetical protein
MLQRLLWSVIQTGDEGEDVGSEEEDDVVCIV